MAFDHTDDDQVRFWGYSTAPFPCVLDGEVEEFVDGLVDRGQAWIATVMEVISEPSRQVLRCYAVRAASQAVQTQDGARLVGAVVALIAGGLDSGSREAMMSAACVDDAVRRLGGNPDVVFRRAADIVGRLGSNGISAWLRRTPNLRSIEAMGYAAVEDELGFHYRLTFGGHPSTYVPPTRLPHPAGDRHVVLWGVTGPEHAVVKEVRALTGLGLADAKALVDRAPVRILTCVDDTTAGEARERLEEAGGTAHVE